MQAGEEIPCKAAVFGSRGRLFRNGTCLPLWRPRHIHLHKAEPERVFVPLTDNNRYESQIYVRLLPESGRVEISVPIQVSVRNHEDYSSEVGLALGIFTMLTTDQGHCYGENLGELQTEYAQWVRERTAAYNRSRRANPGRKKYNEQKRRYQERIHGYINQELNRFFRTEKPGRVYLVSCRRPRREASIGRSTRA